MSSRIASIALRQESNSARFSGMRLSSVYVCTMLIVGSSVYLASPVSGQTLLAEVLHGVEEREEELRGLEAKKWHVRTEGDWTRQFKLYDSILETMDEQVSSRRNTLAKREGELFKQISGKVYGNEILRLHSEMETTMKKAEAFHELIRSTDVHSESHKDQLRRGEVPKLHIPNVLSGETKATIENQFRMCATSMKGGQHDQAWVTLMDSLAHVAESVRDSAKRQRGMLTIQVQNLREVELHVRNEYCSIMGGYGDLVAVGVRQEQIIGARTTAKIHFEAWEVAFPKAGRNPIRRR